MLLVDKYRPKSLDQTDYHKVLATRLHTLVRIHVSENFVFKRLIPLNTARAQSEDFPHLLFYGPSGAGKKTRILCLLRSLFGPGVEKVKSEQRSYSSPNKNTSVDVTTISSNFHIEMNPSESGYHDRIVVQEVIKEIAQSQPLETSAQARSFKIVVLNEVDKLTTEAQAGLRRTMEKYMRTCRLILVCNSITKVIPAVRSRCLCVRIAAPTVPEIRSVLDKIALAEKFTLPPAFAVQIAKAANRNLRRAILMLETCKVQQYPFQQNQKIAQPDWETFIGQVADRILNEQSPKRLLEIRGKVYELMVHCIPAELIMKKLAIALLDRVPIEFKGTVIELAAFYDHRLAIGSKAIFHLEAFVAKFMAAYKDFVINGNATPTK